MSLQAQPIPAIPEITAQIARRAFRKGNVYMQMCVCAGQAALALPMLGQYPFAIRHDRRSHEPDAGSELVG